MNFQEWSKFLLERQDVLWMRTGEHLMLAGVSTLVASILGILLGVIAFKNPRVKTVVLGLTGILQTVPSLALLVFLMALYGRIGILPALTALILYALLPVVRNTTTGLESVDRAVIEAAEGVGMTDTQVLLKVRLPLAAPVIVAGVRTAAVVGIGVATLAAFIGAGGLGEFINRGLALANNDLILLGAIPAALLAIITDLTLSLMEWGISKESLQPIFKTKKIQTIFKRMAIATPFFLLGFSLWGYASSHGLTPGHGPGTISIGTKHTAEQIILGEMLAQTLEAKTNLRVIRRFDFPGTMFCHEAMLKKELDLYPEYTGTALCAVLNKKPIRNAAACFELVKSEYARKFALRWLSPFGFDNKYVMVVRRDRAMKEGWNKISDLKDDAGTLTVGISAEFAEREDGYPGFRKVYGFGFGAIKEMDSNLVYRAVKRKEIDIADAGLTDGRLLTYDLFILEDDRKFFPPYEAAPVIREETIKEHPEVMGALEELADLLDNDTMTILNREVNGRKRAPFAVVKEFLKERGLIDSSRNHLPD